MSYSILYNTLFITDGTYLLSLLEEGPSNVYEYGNKKRARSWYPALFNGSVFPTTRDELYSCITEERTKGEYKEYIKYRGSWLSRMQYLDMLERRAAKAITIEQAKAKGIRDITLIFLQYNPIYDDVLTTRLDLLQGSSLKGLSYVIEDCVKKKVRSIHTWEASIFRVPVPKKEKKARDFSFVLYSAKGNFPAYVKRHMLFFYRHVDNAKHFASIASAQNFAKTWKNAFGDTYRILKINTENTVLATYDSTGKEVDHYEQRIT